MERWVRSIGIAAVATALAACQTRYRSAPLHEEQVLRDLQAIRLAALSPPATGGHVTGAFDPADGLSADEAVAVAMFLNPELRAFRRARGVAEAERVAAGLLENPELGITWLHIPGFTKSLATSGIGLDLSWTPPRPGERGAKTAAAGAHVAEVREQVAGEEWRVAAEVRTAHAVLRVLDEQIRLADAAVKSEERVREFVRAKKAGGEANRLDESLVEIELADALQRREGHVAERDLARLDLDRLLGIPPGEDVRIQAEPDPLVYRAFHLDATRLEAAMLAHRPDLRAAREEYRRTEEELRLACIQSMPWFHFGPAYDRDGSAGEGSIDRWGLAVGFEIPVANRNQGEIGRLGAERTRLRDAFVAKVHGGRAEVNEALSTLRARERLLRLYEERVRPALEESERLLQAGIDAHEIDLLRVLASQEKAIESRSAHVDALREYWSAAFDLERALGLRLDDMPVGKE